jgi:pimeloyl-ACP methyl ester carboxylesterase
MARTATTASGVTSGDGTRIAYERTGTGPALVIVDGAMCSRAVGPSEATAAALSGDITVYRYDRRGRGESTDTKPYAVAREVEDLAAVMAVAGGSPSVYGISSGAGLALEAAAGGVAISRLVLFEPPYTAEGGDTTQQRESSRQMDELLNLGRNGDAVELFFSWVGMPEDAVAQMRNSPLWPVLEAMAPTIAYDNAAMGDGTVPHETAGRITTPTLVIAGCLSSDELRNAAKTVADAIPGARYRDLEGQSHTASPETLAPLLKEFITGRL